MSLKGFEKYLNKCMQEAGFSTRQAARILSRNYGVSHATVWRDHTGESKDIPESRLRAYAELYRVDYNEFAKHLAATRYGIDWDRNIEDDGIHRKLELILKRGGNDSITLTTLIDHMSEKISGSPHTKRQ